MSSSLSDKRDNREFSWSKLLVGLSCNLEHYVQEGVRVMHVRNWLVGWLLSLRMGPRGFSLETARLQRQAR